MQPSFELFDHTADIGIRVRAETLPGLVVPAGEAVYSVIGDLVACAGIERWAIDLKNGDPATLLRDYLAELLLRFEQAHRIAASVDVTVFDQNRLTVIVGSRQVDEERTVYHREVKAVTYHELDIKVIAGGFEATLILDI